MAVVYKITSPSGKSYIGVAKRSADERFKKHCRDARLGRGTALCAAIRKYGADSMSVTTLVESTSEYCFDLEIKTIRAFGTLHPHGYNLTTGGEGIHEMAEASKAKHRASMRNPARLAAISDASKAFNSRPEVREQKSRLMKERWASKEWRKRMKMIAKEKKMAKIKAQPTEPEPLVKKSCDHCYATYDCEKKVSSYKKYCCRACSQAASYAAKKERMHERF